MPSAPEWRSTHTLSPTATAGDRSAHLRFAWFCLWSPRQKAEVPVRAVASVRDALLKHDGAEALGRSRIESGIRQRQTGIGVEAHAAKYDERCRRTAAGEA